MEGTIFKKCGEARLKRGRCPSWLPVMWLPDRRKLSLPSAMLGRLHCISWIAWTMIVLDLVRAHIHASPLPGCCEKVLAITLENRDTKQMSLAATRPAPTRQEAEERAGTVPNLGPGTKIWGADEQEGRPHYHGCQPLESAAKWEGCRDTHERHCIASSATFWEASFAADTAAGITQRGGVTCNGSVATMPLALWRFARELKRRNATSTERKYLVSRNLQGSGGFGSKLLGVASVYFWALLTDRNFVIEWEHPHPLLDVFVPAQEDWRVETHLTAVDGALTRTTGEGGHAVAQARRQVDYGDDVLLLDLEDQTLDCQMLREGDLNNGWGNASTVVCDGCNILRNDVLASNPRYQDKLLESGLLPFIARCQGRHSGIACPECAGALRGDLVCWRDLHSDDDENDDDDAAAATLAAYPSSRYGCDRAGPWIGLMLTALFRPSPALLHLVNRSRVHQHMRGAGLSIALHLRRGFGRQLDEGHLANKAIKSASWMFSCAKNLTRSFQANAAARASFDPRGVEDEGVVWFVAADHREALDQARDHASGVNATVLTVPKDRVVHIDRSRSVNIYALSSPFLARSLARLCSVAFLYIALSHIACAFVMCVSVYVRVPTHLHKDAPNHLRPPTVMPTPCCQN